MAKIFLKLVFQVPHEEWQLGNTCKTTYELKTIYRPLTSNVEEHAFVLDKAIETAVSNGADINKRMRWTTVTELEMVLETFKEFEKEIPSMNWGKNNNPRDGQYVYGDVVDYVKDHFPLVRDSEYEEMFLTMAVGKYAISKMWKG